MMRGRYRPRPISNGMKKQKNSTKQKELKLTVFWLGLNQKMVKRCSRQEEEKEEQKFLFSQTLRARKDAA